MRMKRKLSIEAFAVAEPGTAPDVSFVPPLLRRRLSPLQRLFFALAREVGADAADWIVFSSRDGEDTLTRRIVADFRADGSVSPHRFSASVYNAAPGLWSVFSENKAPYTAIAAGDDSIECGLLELLAGERGSAVLVYAEETGGGYGAALRIGPSGGPGRQVEVTDGGGAEGSIGFRDFADFLSGTRRELRGKWIAWKEEGDGR